MYLPRRADQGALAAPTEEPPPLAGWMWKKSGSRHGFKRRWFLLTDGRLRYYNKKPNAAAVAKASQRSAQQGYDYGCKGFLRLHEVRRVRSTLFNLLVLSRSSTYSRLTRYLFPSHFSTCCGQPGGAHPQHAVQRGGREGVPWG